MGNSKRKVIITGGSRGIGAEAVRRFASLGDEVAFIYRRSDEEGKLLSDEAGARAFKCDVSDPLETMRVMDEIMTAFGGVCDCLVCNAGISSYGLITYIGHEGWKEVIDTNLNSAYYCIDSVLPGMVSEKAGSIILISSMWGQVGASCEVAYSASKAGLIGLTKALAKEVGPSNIRVNCIAPGLIDTDMISDIDKEALDEIVAETPIGRMGTPADVVDAMEFLASDKASFITGQVLAVNGGLVI